VGLTASAVACAGLLLSLRTTDDEPFSTPLPLFIGGVLGMIITVAWPSESVSLVGTLKDMQVESGLFGTSTHCLVDVDGKPKQVKVRSIVLGLQKGDQVEIKGSQPLFEESDEIEYFHIQKSKAVSSTSQPSQSLSQR
jgi:hypothetical protein